ncbi:MAG: phage integrase N-terminal SAM-like domain-containing protein, partial [Bacteroidota bacterium]
MEVNQFTPATAERGTLTARIQDFLGTLANRKPETRRTYELALREFMRWYDQESSFCFSGDDVLRYREHLRFRKNMRVSSVATYLNGFRQFCEYLFQQGIIQYNPVRDVVSYRRPAVHDQEVLSSEEVKRLLAAVDTSEKRGLRDLLI